MRELEGGQIKIQYHSEEPPTFQVQNINILSLKSFNWSGIASIFKKSLKIFLSKFIQNTYNTKSIILTIFKCTAQWHYLHCCATIGIPLPPLGKPYILSISGFMMALW